MTDLHLPQIAPDRPKVVIVGAGFGGLYAAKSLRKAAVHVTVVDRRNHHLFQPLLYQVATAALSPGDIAHPIRVTLRKHKNTDVLLGEVVSIDTADRKVILDDGELNYDYLILAPGARYTYYGHEEWEAEAPGLKSLEDALEIRRRILLAFEKAEREQDPQLRKAWLTFAIVGGGPTGVELAGAIAEISRQVMVDDFRSIDPREAQVILVEHGPRILATFPPSLSDNAEKALRKLGAWVWTNQKVTGIEPGKVYLGERVIEAQTILWAAGVVGSPLAKSLDAPLEKDGRVIVNEDLTIPGHPEIFVIGDLASFKHQDGKPLPGVAPVAIQQGKHAAANVERAVGRKPLEPFRYADKGNLATIGRAAAVADLGRLKLTGLIAWMTWLLVHVFYLIGFRNRVAVMFTWAWSYFRFQRSARLITGDVNKVYAGKRDRLEKPTAEHEEAGQSH